MLKILGRVTLSLLITIFSLFTYGLIFRWILLCWELRVVLVCLFVLVNCYIYTCYLELPNALKWQFWRVSCVQLKDVYANEMSLEFQNFKNQLLWSFIFWDQREKKNILLIFINVRIKILRKIHIGISIQILSIQTVNKDFFPFVASLFLCTELYILKD